MPTSKKTNEEAVKQFWVDFFNKGRWNALSEEDIKEIEKQWIVRPGEWAKIMELLNEQQEKADKKYLIENKKKRVEQYFEDKLINEFLDKHFKSEPLKVKLKIKNAIKKEADEFDGVSITEEVEHSFLNDLLNTGHFTFTDNSKSQKSKWRYLGYSWSVLMNIITVIVIVAIYDAATTSFETIALSGLILIYTQLINFGSGWSLLSTQQSFALHGEFKRLRLLLGEQATRQEDDELLAAKEKVKQDNVKVYISLGFNVLIYIIVLIKIFGVL